MASPTLAVTSQTDGSITASDVTGLATSATTDATNASNISSGTLNIARLADGAVTNAKLAGSIALSKLAITGTPDGTKFIRDDGSYQAINLSGYLPLTGGTLTGALAITAGTLATAPLSITQTFNGGVGVTHRGLEYAVTDTSSAAASTLFRLFGGAAGTSERLSMRKDGYLVLTQSINNSPAITVNGLDRNWVFSFAGGGNGMSFDSQWFDHRSATPIHRQTNGNGTVEFFRLTSTGSAGVMALRGGSSAGAALQMREMSSAPASPAADEACIYLEDNGSGSTRFVAKFSDGTTSVLAQAASTLYLPSSGGTLTGPLVLGASDAVTLGNDATGRLQLGTDSATPISQQIKTADGSGTNIAASNLTLGGSLSTGTGAGGDVITVTSMSGSSGSTANATQERSRVIGRFINLTEGTATNVVSISLPSGKVLGGTAVLTVWASDGTDYQAVTNTVTFNAVNKAGTLTTSSATALSAAAVDSSGAGSLTVTYDVTASGNNLLLRANATSSLTQTILRARLVITALNGDDVQTVTPQ